MSSPMHVLLIEDSDKDATLIIRELRKTADEVITERVDNGEALERALHARRWDIILADYELPSFDALRALDMVRARDVEVSYVIVSGTIGEDVAVKAMRAGAQDYIMKNRLARLGPLVMREIAETKVRRERARAIDALRESEARKTAILSAALDAVITMDHQGRILEFNPAAERMFDYAQSDVIGKEMADLIIPPAQHDAQRNGLARYLTTGESTVLGHRVELRAMRRGGAEFPAEIAVVRIPREGLPMFTGFIRDVTDRNRWASRQRLLVEAGARLAHSLDDPSMLQGIAELVVGHVADGCGIELLDDGGNLRRVATAVRRSAEHDHFEIHPFAHLPAGITLQVVHERKPAFGPASSPGYMVVPLLAREKALGAITVMHASERAVFASEDLDLVEELAARCAMAVDNAKLFSEVRESVRLRDDFIAIAAHELRTPLTPLRMQAQSLLEKVESKRLDDLTPARLETPVRRLVRSCDRLIEMVERLLDFSQLTVSGAPLNLAEYDLVALASEVVDELSSAFAQVGSTVQWNVPKAPIWGRWDGNRVKLAFRNLLENATKFAPGKPIEIAVEGTATIARLTVKDSGPGLSSEDQSRLFERYRRQAPIRNYGGFGLGLWIVRRVADEHGGRVEVSSVPNKGATFALIVPRISSPPATPHPHPSTERIDHDE